MFLTNEPPEKDDPYNVGCSVIKPRFKGFSRLYPCGHRDARKCTLVVFGTRSLFSSRGSVLPRCPKCELEALKQRSKRCSFCARGILPHQQVVLYDGLSKDVRDMNEEELKLTLIYEGYIVGCAECVDTYSSPNLLPICGGYWTGQEFVIDGPYSRTPSGRIVEMELQPY